MWRIGLRGATAVGGTPMVDGAGPVGRTRVMVGGAGMRGSAGRLVLAFLVGLVGAVTLATPAWAHGADAPDGTDYRSEVTEVTPAPPGLTVRTIEAGARLELINRTGRTIEVLGYSGEPYLEVRPEGVFENVNSPATYLNRTLAGDTVPPTNADPAVAPSWRLIADEPVARWHDQRTQWLGSGLPRQAQADPSREHRIREWAVPLRDGSGTVQVRGTLDWVPPPSPLMWWAVSLLTAAMVAFLGLAFRPAAAAAVAQPTAAAGDTDPGTHPVGRVGTVVLAVVAALGGVGAVVFAVAREIDAGSTSLGAMLQGLLTAQTWAVLAGLGALAAAGYALARRPAADFALALAGSCLALFAGVANAAVFHRAIAPVPWPATWARLLIALMIVTGAGVGLAGVLRLRATGRGEAGAATEEAATPVSAGWRVATNSDPAEQPDA
ncbi:hypothetical protein GCM10027280_26900 [Micromonospora polyrhachis]|uniref:Uncharacterized protein n=1 Tax=Micromonospora polyrhachis TaxID=1282883 RepID=A0A7W7WP16_9ACTN|nr:hypothetical protein [Micromonospora polyrhachis]MBB4957783.1 hypothetical protein [Micromonospora polyrhachis]